MKREYRLLIGALEAVALAIALALIASGGQGSLAADGIIYVDADATGANNGTSWVDAYTDLQSALADPGTADEIWVAEGTYKPASNGDRHASFQMRNGLALYGGFDPSVGATEFDDRDSVTYVTILSGDLNGDDGPNFQNNGDNSYHVFYHPDGTALDGSAILDGFTIIGGNANEYPDENGGGMYNYGSSPALTNCTFSGNSAESAGGGMYNFDSSSPVLTNCTFSDNYARFDGGGMLNHFSSPTLTDCTFSDNYGGGGGGGIYNYNSSPLLTNCTFSANSTYNRGGAMNNLGGSPALVNCTFSGNSSNYVGGGMYNDYSSPALTNCTFSGNSADDSGGGMYDFVSASPVLTGCTFSGNSAGLGGGIYNYNDSSSPMLSNCTFSGNSADRGGGMYNADGSSPALTNCAFSNNSANTGGGMFNHNSSSPTLTNCTLWGNSADSYGGGMANNFSSLPRLTNCILWDNSPDQISNYNSTPVVIYSDVQGSYSGDGNIEAYPWFVDPDNGDFHLEACSPCIDSGDSSAPDLPDYDFEGDSRILDGDGDGMAVVDMGVDEVAVAGTCIHFYVYLPVMLRGH